MLSYTIKINSNTLYRIEVTRLNDLTTIKKYNNYHFALYDDNNCLRHLGQVKHRYVDGVFVLMSKVNKEIHKQIKDRPESKFRIRKSFNQIKMAQNLGGIK